MATKTSGSRLRVMPTRPANTLERAVSDYLAAVAARGGSSRTDEYYENTLRAVFLPWLVGEKVASLDQLDQQLLDRFNRHLLGKVSEHTGKPLSRPTVATYLRAVNQFVRWAQTEGLANEKLKVQSVTVQRKILDTLSREEIAALESAATTERDKLIIRILGDAGLRLNELLTLTIDSLVEQARERYIKVEGKGARQRLVPVLPAVYSRLHRFAKSGRPVETNSARIFVSLRRRPSGEYEPLDPRAVQQMLHATARKAGIAKSVHPHLLRHSMITNALRRPGTNALTVARIVGHSDMSMIVNVYSHLTASDTHAEMLRILRQED